MWFTGQQRRGVGRITLPPLVRDLAPDQITTTSARLRGKLRPNSQATEYHFEYGTTDGLRSEHAHDVRGQLYDLLAVMARVDGLAARHASTTTAWSPSNDAGHTEGPDRVFRQSRPRRRLVEPTTTEPPAEDPDFAKTVVVAPEGIVVVKAPGGKWESMDLGRRAALGAIFDTRLGACGAQQRGLPGQHADRHASAAASSRSASRARAAAESTCTCAAGASRLPAARHAASSRAAVAPPRPRPRKARRVRKLWGRDHGGRFRSHGRHSHATVRGTRWLTVDRCDGTLTRVTNGAVVRPRLHAAPHRRWSAPATRTSPSRAQALRRQQLARRHHR